MWSRVHRIRWTLRAVINFRNLHHFIPIYVWVQLSPRMVWDRFLILLLGNESLKVASGRVEVKHFNGIPTLINIGHDLVQILFLWFWGARKLLTVKFWYTFLRLLCQSWWIDKRLSAWWYQSHVIKILQGVSTFSSFLSCTGCEIHLWIFKLVQWISAFQDVWSWWIELVLLVLLFLHFYYVALEHGRLPLPFVLYRDTVSMRLSIRGFIFMAQETIC